jgi:hypothetical protein
MRKWMRRISAIRILGGLGSSGSRAFSGLLGNRDNVPRRRNGPFRSPFLFYVLGAVGNFVIDLFDFSREVKILRILCVRFEKGVPLRFQVVAFFLPYACSCHHGLNLRTSVHLFEDGG